MVIRLVSTLCAASLLTGLLAASPIAPQVAARQSTSGTGAPVLGTGGMASEVPGVAVGGPRTRTPYPKVPSKLIELPVHQATGKPTWNGRLLVKFRDDLRARADAMPTMFVRNRVGEPMPEVTEILANFGGTVRSALRQSPEELRALERRAESVSGRAQPDLAGLVYVDVRPEQLVATARAFNDLDMVEFVEIESSAEQHRQNFSSQFGCGQPGENAPPPTQPGGINNCYTASLPPAPFPLNRCSTLGGGSGCNNNDCDADIVLPECRAGCNNAECCGLISECLPGCGDTESGQGWDALCATYANMLCAQIGSAYDGGNPVNGAIGSLPASYKFDPCFALRGALSAPLDPITIQGLEVTPLPPAPVPPFLPGDAVPGGLLTYDQQLLSESGGAFITAAVAPPGATPNEAIAVAYPTASITDEADALSGVPQQALPDPSLEGAGQLVAGGCFTPHAPGGCDQVTCCVYVCRNDPACCIVEWDENCVTIAANAPSHPTLGSPCIGEGLPTPTTPDYCVEFPLGPYPNTGFPVDAQTPDLTGGRVWIDFDPLNPQDIPASPCDDQRVLGNARGYQAYTVGQPVIDPFFVPGAGVGFPIPVPPPEVWTSDRVTPSPNRPCPNITGSDALVTTDPARTNGNGNLGTTAFLNSGYRGGGLDLFGFEKVLCSLGLNPLAVGRGQGTTVAVIDISAFVDHEDLVNRVNPEPGQNPVLIQQNPIDPDHGTAVLGVIGAEDNGFGITGIASGAQLNFYPSVSIEEGERLLAALTQALIDLDEGDVICLPIGFNGNAVVSSPSVNALVRLGTDAGIATVCSAGNAGVGINPGPIDSGAIIVTACWPGYRLGAAPLFQPQPNGLPGLNYCRFQNSNFEPQEPIPGIDQAAAVSGWGAGVASCGYGDLFRGENASADPLQVNQLRTYTSGESFQGTSAAAAMIAGWVSRLQGFSLAYFGTALPVAETPLPPDVPQDPANVGSNLRSALKAPGNFFLQCGLPYESGQFPGYPENCEQYGDILRLNQGGSLARIGGFPRTASTASWLVANAFAGANPVTFDIITGTYQAGGAFSLREVDGIALRIAGQRRRAGNKGQGFGRAIFYPLTGSTTDLQISVTSSSPPSSISQVALQTASRVSWPQPVFQIVYFYNFSQNRWVPSGYRSLAAALTAGTYQPAGLVEEFLRPNPSGSGTQIYARVYTCALTGDTYSVLHDQLNFILDVDIFNP